MSEEEHTEQQSRYKNRGRFWATVAFLMIILFFEIVAISLWLPGAWNEKLTAALAVVGIYGLTIGFLSKGAALSQLPGTLEDLTSHNLVSYFLANLRFVAMVSMLIGTGLRQRGRSQRSTPLVIWLALFPVSLAYVVVHMLVIAPLSYIPMAVASTTVLDIIHSPEDSYLTLTDTIKKTETGRVRIRDLAGEDPVATKALLVGIPALSMSILSGIAALFTAS